MENPLQQVFLDKNNNIFVVDDRGVLYYYDDYIFTPFTIMMPDIRKVFIIDDNFYVHHGTTMTIFDPKLKEIEHDEDEDEPHWIGQNIKSMDYNSEFDMIVSIEDDDEVMAHYNVTNRYPQIYGRQVLKTNLDISNICLGEIQNIKIVNNFLLCYTENRAFIFLINETGTEYIRHIPMTQYVFNQIIGYDEKKDWYELADGDKVSTRGNIFLNRTPNTVSQNDIYMEHGAYLIKNIGHITCYWSQKFNKSGFNNIDKFLTVKSNNTDNDVCITTFTVSTDFQIIQNNKMQLLFIDHKLYTIYHNEIVKIAITDDNIDYDYIFEEYTDKPGCEFNIDLYEKTPLVDQLITIIPRMYRLNCGDQFIFEYIDTADNAISYGDGVTRHVFNNLRKEIDEILRAKFADFKYSIIDLGKLFYFCNHDSGQLFQNLHPYFFYHFATENEYLLLLKKFKSNDYPLLSQQYLEYCNNPQKLATLDIGLTTIHDYMKYLFTSDLTPQEIAKYDDFIEGFNRYNQRNIYIQLIKNLPITYYFAMLIADEYFNAYIKFIRKNDSVKKELYDLFCKKFEQEFNKMTPQKKLIFLQNVSGNQYYVGPVLIRYGYREPNQIISVQQAEYNANVIDPEESDLDIPSIPIDSDDDDDEANMIDPNFDNNKPLEYHISTCNIELNVYIPPTDECITKLLDALTTEDPTLKN